MSTAEYHDALDEVTSKLTPETVQGIRKRVLRKRQQQQQQPQPAPRRDNMAMMTTEDTSRPNGSDADTPNAAKHPVESIRFQLNGDRFESAQSEEVCACFARQSRSYGVLFSLLLLSLLVVGCQR